VSWTCNGSENTEKTSKNEPFLTFKASKHKRKTKQYFSEEADKMVSVDNSTSHLASAYDSQVYDTIPYYDSFHQETINLLKAMHVQPRVWLDTGCGTGTLVHKALLAFPKTLFVLADPSLEMLNTAKKKLANTGTGRVRFLEPTSTQNLPKNLAGVDVITAIQSHHYCSRQERNEATTVCFELLISNGVYITFENIRPFTSKGVEIGKENWKNFQIARGKTPEAVERHLERFDSEYFPITVDEHLSLLRRTGFSTVELLWYSYMQAGFYCLK
jgi:tRNA (cmo5U34)-methyltransferase